MWRKRGAGQEKDDSAKEVAQEKKLQENGDQSNCAIASGFERAIPLL